MPAPCAYEDQSLGGGQGVGDQGSCAQRRHVPRALSQHLSGYPMASSPTCLAWSNRPRDWNAFICHAVASGKGDGRGQVVELEAIDAAVGFARLFQRRYRSLLLVVALLGEAEVGHGEADTLAAAESKEPAPPSAVSGRPPPASENCRDWSRLFWLSANARLGHQSEGPARRRVASDLSPSLRSLARTSTASDSAFPLSSSFDCVRSAAP